MMITLTLTTPTPEALRIAMLHAVQHVDVQRASYQAKLTIRVDRELTAAELGAKLKEIAGPAARVERE